MPLYGGIDLHANNSVIVLLNEQDEVIYRKRLSNNLPVILGQLDPYHTELKGLVVESTSNWYWLVDGLMEVSYRVHLANPAAIQQYNGLKDLAGQCGRRLGHRAGLCRPLGHGYRLHGPGSKHCLSVRCAPDGQNDPPGP